MCHPDRLTAQNPKWRHLLIYRSYHKASEGTSGTLPPQTNIVGHMTLLLGQAPSGALSSWRCPAAAQLAKPNAPLFSKHKKSSFPGCNLRKPPSLTLANAVDADVPPSPSSSASRPSSTLPADDPVLVTGDDVPLEGVIQFDKQSSAPSQLRNWGKVAFLAGGDALFLIIFAAIGRFSHGLPVLDFDTFRTADPFVAGWFLGAYFLGGYSDDGRGENGSGKATLAAAKSWAVGIPLGIAIRTFTLGHIPPTSFMLVTMGSTAVLLIGWRTLFHRLFASGGSAGNDDYRKGNPFELFELLTSLIRRW